MTIGLLPAMAGARAFRDMPYGIRPLEPVDLVGSAILLAAVGFLATRLAGRRNPPSGPDGNNEGRVTDIRPDRLRVRRVVSRGTDFNGIRWSPIRPSPLPENQR